VKRSLSVSDVRERLPVCKSLVYRLVNDGTRPSTRFGGKILIPEDGLEGLLARGAGRDEPPPAPPARKAARRAT
jgi:excisionase family DNA binding protein